MNRLVFENYTFNSIPYNLNKFDMSNMPNALTSHESLLAIGALVPWPVGWGYPEHVDIQLEQPVGGCEQLIHLLPLHMLLPFLKLHLRALPSSCPLLLNASPRVFCPTPAGSERCWSCIPRLHPLKQTARRADWNYVTPLCSTAPERKMTSRTMTKRIQRPAGKKRNPFLHWMSPGLVSACHGTPPGVNSPDRARSRCYAEG